MPKVVRIGRETVSVPTVHDVVMGPGGWPHGRTPEDREWAASLARRDAVIQATPDSGLADAWSLIETLVLRSVQPLDMASLEPTAEPFADATSAVDWYERHPADGAAVRTGAQGDWSLLGVRVKSWGSWAKWLSTDATDEIIRPMGEYDRPAAVRSLRPMGEATTVLWEEVEDKDPHRLGRIGQVTRGHAAGRQAALQVLRDMTSGPDGGWLLWPVRAVDGRLASFRARSVNEHLEVLPDHYPVPVAGVRHGLRLRTAGRVLSRPDDSSVAWCPAWLLGRFGGRYR